MTTIYDKDIVNRGLKGGNPIIRDGKLNPPNVRKILQTIGNEKITDLKLIREPLSRLTTILLKITTLGQLEKILKEENIDKLFHTSLYVNNKYRYDKQEVVKLVRDKVNLDKVEFLSVGDSRPPTTPYENGVQKGLATLPFDINTLVMNTQLRMGQNYGNYSARDNNCSIFLQNVLDANNLSTPTSEMFLKQKSIELVDKFPSISKILIKFITGLGGFVNRQIFGEGKGK